MQSTAELSNELNNAISAYNILMLSEYSYYLTEDEVATLVANLTKFHNVELVAQKLISTDKATALALYNELDAQLKTKEHTRFKFYKAKIIKTKD